MKVLFLGPAEKFQIELIKFLKNNMCTVCRYSKNLNGTNLDYQQYDFLISYGYRYIISGKILNHFLNRAINLHISFLPWNKGADPNLWSILDDTPKGVTIHYIDEGIDTGKILFQKEIVFKEDDTLKITYDKLNSLIVDLFKSNWHLIKDNSTKPIKQYGRGSYHRKSDKFLYEKLLVNNWNTKIINLIGKGKNVKN